MDNIQKTINEKEKEREEINENITQLKTKISSSQTTSNLARKSIEKLTLEIKNLENLQMVLEEGQSIDSLIESASNDISECENIIEESKKEIEKRQQTQAEIDTKIKDNEEEKSLFKAEISKIQQNISSNKAQIKVLKENSRIPIRGIAKKTGIRPSTVHERIKKLIKENVIEKFTLKLNNKSIGQNFIIFNY